MQRAVTSDTVSAGVCATAEVGANGIAAQAIVARLLVTDRFVADPHVGGHHWFREEPDLVVLHVSRIAALAISIYRET